jgi:hypothetical protein
VAELTPARRHRFVERDAAVAAFPAAALIDPDRWRADLDRHASQDPRRVRDSARERGVIDTSGVFGLERIDPETLPLQLAIATITLPELTAGPHATSDPSERARRQQRDLLIAATALSAKLPLYRAVSQAPAVHRQRGRLHALSELVDPRAVTFAPV